MPRISMLRFLKTCSCSGPKSSPTTPTTRTSVKWLAARLKCVAEPASSRSTKPDGVLMESYATEPTTRIANLCPSLLLEVFTNNRLQLLKSFQRNTAAVRHDRRRERLVALARMFLRQASNHVLHHVAGVLRVLVQHGDNLLHRHVIVIRMPAVVVCHHGQRGVTN